MQLAPALVGVVHARRRRCTPRTAAPGRRAARAPRRAGARARTKRVSSPRSTTTRSTAVVVCRRAVARSRARCQVVGDVVEVAAVGTFGGPGQQDRRDQPAVAAGVRLVAGAEHAAALADLGRLAVHSDGVRLPVRTADRWAAAGLLWPCPVSAWWDGRHASRPFIWCVGVAVRAAASAARAAASRFTPSGMARICSCSLTMA